MDIEPIAREDNTGESVFSLDKAETVCDTLNMRYESDEAMTEQTRYDYDLQCWVVDGLVSGCGHSEQVRGCYACTHVGDVCVDTGEDDDLVSALDLA